MHEYDHVVSTLKVGVMISSLTCGVVHLRPGRNSANLQPSRDVVKLKGQVGRGLDEVIRSVDGVRRAKVILRGCRDGAGRPDHDGGGYRQHKYALHWKPPVMRWTVVSATGLSCQDAIGPSIGGKRAGTRVLAAMENCFDRD
jgi:hypothetical protein